MESGIRSTEGPINVNIRSVWCRTASEAPLLRKCLSGVGIVVESLSDFHLSFFILIFNKAGMLTVKPIFYFLTVVRHASHPIHQYFVFVSGTLPEAEMLLNLKEEPIPEDPLETGTVSKVKSEPESDSSTTGTSHFNELVMIAVGKDFQPGVISSFFYLFHVIRHFHTKGLFLCLRHTSGTLRTYIHIHTHTLSLS